MGYSRKLRVKEGRQGRGKNRKRGSVCRRRQEVRNGREEKIIDEDNKWPFERTPAEVRKEGGKYGFGCQIGRKIGINEEL